MCYDVKCYRRASTNIVNLVLTTYYGKNSQYFSKMVSVWTNTQIKCDVFRTERGILSNQENCLFFSYFYFDAFIMVSMYTRYDLNHFLFVFT